MAITVSPTPPILSWDDFKPVPSLPDEDAHIDIGFTVPNKNFRRVGGRFKMAETLAIVVRPVAKVVQGASKTAELLAHEQGHYEIGILVGKAMARDFMALEAATPRKLAEEIGKTFDLHRLTRMKPIQEKYDDDTHHSADKTEQKRWDDAIKACKQSASPCATLDGLDL